MSPIRAAYFIIILLPLGFHAQIFHQVDDIEVYHNNNRIVFESIGIQKTSQSLHFADSTINESLSHIFRNHGNIYGFSYEKKQMFQLKDNQWHLLKDSSKLMLDGELTQWGDKILWIGRTVVSHGRNLILYFDEPNNIWTPLANQKIEPTASYLSEFTVFEHNDKLILFKCFMPSPDQPYTSVKSRNIFQYDLVTSRWSRLRSFFEIPQNIELIDGTSNYTAFVEPDTDRLFILDQNVFIVREFSIKMLFGFEKPIKYGVHGNVLWAYFNENSLKSIVINELIENVKAEKNIWYLKSDLIWTIMGGLMVIVSLFSIVMVIFNRRKSKQTLVLNGEMLWFGSKKRKLTKAQLSFLTQMLSGATLDFYDVVSLFSKKNLSISHSHKLKNDLIREVQEILESLMGNSKALIVEKSPEDSRMSVYRLNLDIFDPTCVTDESNQPPPKVA